MCQHPTLGGTHPAFKPPKTAQGESTTRLSQRDPACQPETVGYSRSSCRLYSPHFSVKQGSYQAALSRGHGLSSLKFGPTVAAEGDADAVQGVPI